MPPERRAFYEYHASLVEPWDGPAALALHRRQLRRRDARPQRPPPDEVRRHRRAASSSPRASSASSTSTRRTSSRRGACSRGAMLLVDMARGRLVGDEEIKQRDRDATSRTRQWLEGNKLDLASLPVPALAPPMSAEERRRRMRAFGYSREDLRVLLAPMATNGEEPTGSMGNDAPLAVLSERPQLFFRYFKQQFAQVTNPPIDPIREKLVMTLASCLGGEGNLLAETPRSAACSSSSSRSSRTRSSRSSSAGALAGLPGRGSCRCSSTPRGDPALARARRSRRLCARGGARGRRGREHPRPERPGRRRDHAAIPSLLATSAVHHALARTGKRMRVGLVVETGEAREVADVALLIGYGAGAVNPYLAFEAIDALDVETPRDERARALRARARQGPAQGHEQDGHLVPVELPGRADLRGRRRRQGDARSLVPGDGVAHRRHRPREIARETLLRHARGLRGGRRGGQRRGRARRRRRLRVARRAASGTSGARRRSPACRRRCASRTRARTRSTRAPSTTRATRPSRCAAAGTSRRAGEPVPARGGRAGGEDRAPLRDRAR